MKNNIDSCLKILGITENENNKEKERKHWIPNQVGDDDCMVFGDDIGVVFGDDSYCGSSIKDFEDDKYHGFLLGLVKIKKKNTGTRFRCGFQEVFLFK